MVLEGGGNGNYFLNAQYFFLKQKCAFNMQICQGVFFFEYYFIYFNVLQLAFSNFFFIRFDKQGIGNVLLLF